MEHFPRSCHGAPRRRMAVHGDRPMRRHLEASLSPPLPPADKYQDERRCCSGSRLGADRPLRGRKFPPWQEPQASPAHPSQRGHPATPRTRPPRRVQGKSPPSQTQVVFPLTRRLRDRAKGKEQISRGEILFRRTGFFNGELPGGGWRAELSSARSIAGPCPLTMLDCAVGSPTYPHTFHVIGVWEDA